MENKRKIILGVIGAIIGIIIAGFILGTIAKKKYKNCHHEPYLDVTPCKDNGTLICVEDKSYVLTRCYKQIGAGKGSGCACRTVPTPSNDCIDTYQDKETCIAEARPFCKKFGNNQINCFESQREIVTSAPVGNSTDNLTASAIGESLWTSVSLGLMRKPNPCLLEGPAPVRRNATRR